MYHSVDSTYQGLNDLFEIWIESSYNNTMSINTTTINTTTMAQCFNLSLIYIFQVFFIFFLLLIFAIIIHSFYVLISWFIHRVGFNSSPFVLVCHCCCWLFSFFASSDIQNHIVLYSTASTYDNFNTVFGTMTVCGKFDNRVRRLRGPHVYKYPLFAWIQKLSIYLSHVCILGTHQCGKEHNEAFKRRGILQFFYTVVTMQIR